MSPRGQMLECHLVALICRQKKKEREPIIESLDLKLSHRGAAGGSDSYTLAFVWPR